VRIQEKAKCFQPLFRLTVASVIIIIAAPIVSYISIAEDFCVHLIVPKADQIVPQGEADWILEALD